MQRHPGSIWQAAPVLCFTARAHDALLPAGHSRLQDMQQLQRLHPRWPLLPTASHSADNRKTRSNPRRQGMSFAHHVDGCEAEGAACGWQMWIAGILALSLVWCFVSLLAVSRLEKRLPSEMQDQLEFHTAFSGLWPKAQGAAAGSKLAHCNLFRSTGSINWC